MEKNEEFNDNKKIDFKLMKRIFKFTRPYYFLLVVTIIMMLLATGADLARPYLMKVALDDYISGYNLPMAVMKDKPEVDKYVEYNGEYYIREKYLEENQEGERAQIILKDDKYYLMEGVLEDNEKFTIEKNEDGIFVNDNNQKFKAEELDQTSYELFRTNDRKGLSWIVIIFALILVGGFVCTYAQVYILNYVGQKVIYSMRETLFKHVEKLSLSFFDKNPVGKLVTRLTNDMNNINQMFTDVLISFFKDILLIGGTVIIMFMINAKLALISFVTMPIVIFISIKFRKVSRKAHREVKSKIGKINAVLNENINGMKIIQMFHVEKEFYKDFDEINTEHKTASMKELKIFAVFRPSMDFIYSLALAILIWYGGKGLISGAVEFGVVFAFIQYIQQVFRPIFDLSEKFNIMQSAMASSERVFELLDEKVDIENKNEAIELKEFNGEIEFKNVYFAYGKDWILKDVSFKINPGEAVAFVGATGSGKSTIINLISRMYDIQKGEILIDGVNIKDIHKDSLRNHVSTVLQDVFIFTGDIKENIRLFEKSIDMDKVKEVAKFVNADKFIENLPNKYEEEVVERGATLSTGQRQLLSFARALAFDPSILILDEATSNIDTETETLIQDAISKVIKGRTTIVVAHRLSTIKNCDKIIVLHKGRIKEVGSHEELLEHKGMYHKLYSLQYKESVI